MKRLLLTSAGFENSDIAALFLKETKLSPDKIKVLFIPTAATDEESRAMLPKCRKDLTDIGIKEENIIDYNLDVKLKESEIASFNAVYVCGGSPEHLLKKMNDADFKDIVDIGFKHDLIYIGVSAGSIVCGTNLSDNLGYYDKNIGVHYSVGNFGDNYTNLTNMQAIWIKDNETVILPEQKSAVDSHCGLHCTGCEYKITCGCGGCIETNGHPFHGECPVAVCCKNKGFLHCGECPDIPCELLTQYSCDPEHGDTPKGARIEQCKRWKQQFDNKKTIREH